MTPAPRSAIGYAVLGALALLIVREEVLAAHARGRAEASAEILRLMAG